MALDINDVLTPTTQPEHLQSLLDLATALQLPATSFRPGDIARTILVIFSYAFQRADAATSLINQGAFLDYAATGTVTFQNADGTTTTVPVSPDPSDPEQNPDGKTTWLDILTTSNYNTTRIQATFAGGAQALTNTSASTYGPFTAGTYHVSNPNNSASYSNTGSLSIPPSTVVGTSVSTAVMSGGLIKITTTTNHGLSTGAVVSIKDVVGTTEANHPWYITVVDANEFTLDGSAFVNAYISGGTVYTPTVATMIADEAGTAYNSVNANGVTDVHTVTTAVTALVGVTVSNLEKFVGSDIESNIQLRDRAKLKLQSVSVNGPKGAYEYYALAAQQLAPELSPPQAVAANITRVFANPDNASGTVYVFVANASGAPSTPDLLAVDAVIQAYAVPLAVTAITIAATNLNVDLEVNLWVPAVHNTAANVAIFQAALQDYFEVVPIGGYTDPNGSYTNIVSASDVLGLCYETAQPRGIQIDNGTVEMNGSGGNLSLTVTTTSAEVPVLSPVVPTVTLHSTT